MNTGKVIKISEEFIFVGFTDGSSKKLKSSLFDFTPTIGDEVEIYDDIVIKKINKTHSLPPLVSKFKGLSVISKINILLMTTLFLLALLVSLRDISNFWVYLMSYLFVFTIALVILNLILLAITKYRKNYKKKIVSYLIYNVIIFLFALFTLVLIVPTTDTEESSIENLTTIQEFLSAKGVPVEGYGEIIGEPKESGDFITFMLGKLEDFQFDNNEDKEFSKYDASYVDVTVKIPKNDYISKLNDGDYISIEGKTSQDDTKTIIVDSYTELNFMKTEDSYDSSSSSSTSTSSSSSSYLLDTFDRDKSHFGEVDYDQWNHDEVAEKTKIKISGTVLQEQESDGTHTLRVAMNGDYDKVILVQIDSYNYERTIAEDDQITIYGLAMGRQSYTTVFNATKTLPFMIGTMYEN